MIISCIVAADNHLAIGKDNQLPWHLPEDLKFFKRTTLGCPVVMGRNTWVSLGRPLPGRLNVVITSQPHYAVPHGVLVATSIEAALEQLRVQQVPEVFIIGGGQIFAHTLPMVQRLYLTRVHTVVAGADVFFPAIDPAMWQLVWSEPHTADEKHAFDYTFERYERIGQ
jgi:dihydrofolate reductase